ncbi:M23 family metallopeptidase [Sphingomonas sp. DT-207]|uniref:M23 family metallopeptidase n=1 Tax=Sphingomonas sp. DT-207 TaxID=3396167 RepID=UPI003F1D1ECB
MPGFSTLPLPLVLWLISGAGAGPPAELPTGSSPVFRARMMDWSAAPPPAQPSSSPVQRSGHAVLPRLSSGFGHRSDPIHGARAMHAGIDIPGALGTPVRASASGVVRFAGSAGGYGQMVELDHGNGLSTRYGHLARLLVRPGASVAQGETIALMGSTGRSTGSHLHFEVRAGGRAVNPLSYLTGSTAAEPHSGVMTSTSAEPHRSAFARAREGQRDWQACREVLCVAP